MNAVSAFITGLLFGIGLILSGMTDPGKVMGFLDVFGSWDPSLAFVMGGAVLVSFAGFLLANRRAKTFFGEALHLPGSRDIDSRLVLGSAVFGVGWGLAGYCPGPALVSLGAGQEKAAIFAVAMIAGMFLYEAAERIRRRSSTAAQPAE
jgi:uncharacterized membrane protein YedE/YeeE